jgi:hypothetical protein
MPQAQIDDVVVVLETLLSCEVTHVAHLQIRVLKQILVDVVILLVHILVVIKHCCQSEPFLWLGHHVIEGAPVHIRVEHDLNLVRVYLEAGSVAILYDRIKHGFL